MLFCKKCGQRVEKDDMFCTSCANRLDVEGAVISRAEYASRTGENIDFDAEAVVGESNISGFQVMEYMLTEKIASLCGSEYYLAVKKDKEEIGKTVIRHIRFPQYMDRDVCFMMHRMNHSVTDKLSANFAEGVVKEMSAFRSQCAAAGIESLNFAAKSLYSESYNCYHIFILMKECLPFVSYVQNRRMTLRDVITIGVDISEQLLALQRQGTPYGSFSELSVFVDNKGKAYLDCKLLALYEQFYPYTSIVMYNKTFVSPMNKSFEAYSLAMILYRLLSGFSSPYVNPYMTNISNEVLIQAEEQRMMAQQPILPEKARNMAGSKIVSTLSSSQNPVTLEELHDVLKNSFNYISSAELNEYINGERI